MGVLNFLFGTSGGGSNPIESEKKRHAGQIRTFQNEIDSAQYQIDSLKAETERLKKAGSLTATKKEYQRKRIDEWQEKIKRRRADIEREKEQHKKTIERLKNNK